MGLGAIEGLPAPSPVLLTGEAFFRAEASLKEACSTRAAAVVRSDWEAWDRAANAAFLLLGHLWECWPPAVWRCLARYLESEDLRTAAHAEGVSYQAVHKQFAG